MESKAMNNIYTRLSRQYVQLSYIRYCIHYHAIVSQNFDNVYSCNNNLLAYASLIPRTNFTITRNGKSWSYGDISIIHTYSIDAQEAVNNDVYLPKSLNYLSNNIVRNILNYNAWMFEHNWLPYGIKDGAKDAQGKQTIDMSILPDDIKRVAARDFLVDVMQVVPCRCKPRVDINDIVLNHIKSLNIVFNANLMKFEYDTVNGYIVPISASVMLSPDNGEDRYANRRVFRSLCDYKNNQDVKQFINEQIKHGTAYISEPLTHAAIIA